MTAAGALPRKRYLRTTRIPSRCIKGPALQPLFLTTARRKADPDSRAGNGRPRPAHGAVP